MHVAIILTCLAVFAAAAPMKDSAMLGSDMQMSNGGGPMERDVEVMGQEVGMEVPGGWMGGEVIKGKMGMEGVGKRDMVMDDGMMDDVMMKMKDGMMEDDMTGEMQEGDMNM